MTAYAAPVTGYQQVALGRPVTPRVARTAPSKARSRAHGIRLLDTAQGRRRRRTVAAVIVAVAVAIVGPQAVAGDEPTIPVVFDTYTVAAGETLWSIASSLTPVGEDVNETIDVIQDLNAKGSSVLRAGEQILIPSLD
ncbi:LysM peptidoglycan-binding domain-containing protein [Demequina sp. NBRC 110057]|uniref:LysM peptidoglycan-binding domain-containing protein n=1 Tax=Demequina sp. NBRC 110057 TaxID=1570346 RepID=UPI000A039B83|nr:LysM peptidoglycan-binding domain-containing protein [Demequina sp. NBRC 110057]